MFQNKKRKSILLCLFFPALALISCQKSDKDNSHSNANAESGDGSLITTNTKMGDWCTDLNNQDLNPLGKYQWHLSNVGQDSFATPYDYGVDEETANARKAAAIGQDINALTVLRDNCLSGLGVHVAVVDSGMELIHPSLEPNIDNRPYVSTTWSMNYRNNDFSANDPSPLPDDGADHGTMVSGIIAMRSNMGVGGSGIAPRAMLAGYNIINSDTQSFQNFYESLGGSDAAINNDIFSMSYGMNNLSQVSNDEPTELASISMYKTGTRLLRGGKGALYVKAAGNGFDRLGLDFLSYRSCETATKLKVSCQDSSMNPDNAMPEVITVGALNAAGRKTSYSTTGSSLWISAPGGEFSFDKKWIDSHNARLGKTPINWKNYRATLGEPAIVTTDVSGALQGMSHRVNLDNPSEIFDIRNSFNAGLVSENTSFNYTNSMNGTSSATPVTSGAIATIIEANPNLTWRDVKYILAKTATKVDPDFAGVKTQLTDSTGASVNYQVEQGWINNGAGFHFSNWYGFGRINLADAVKLAHNYTSPLGKYIERPWWPEYKLASMPLTPGDFNGLEVTTSIPYEQRTIIESVMIEISADSSYVGDMALELTSPVGTKSLIWHAGNAFANNGDLKDFIIQSNAFYGENSKGIWKLKLVNTGIHKAPIEFKGWRLKVVGYNK